MAQEYHLFTPHTWTNGMGVKVDAEAWVNLSDAPGMGYALDEERLRATRLA
jgi:hypothetical protein